MVKKLKMKFRLIDTEKVLDDSARRDNISGIALYEGGRRAVLCTDEGSKIIILKQVDQQKWKVVNSLDLLEGDQEADLESLAVHDGWLYVVGSHCARRKRAKSGKSRKKNRKRLTEFGAQPSRRIMARVRLDELTEHDPHVEYDDGSIWNQIQESQILAPFAAIPSKENGIDIEGIAIDNEEILLGFRGPVLRGNYAIAMRTKFRKNESELLFLDLGGRGIRDLCRVEPQQFLILAGPVGDEPTSYQVFSWDGKDHLEGKDFPDADGLTQIGEIPRHADYKEAKPEGIEVLSKKKGEVECVVVYDSAPVGAPIVFRLNSEIE